MPLTGEYEPSGSEWVREHIATIARTGTTQSADFMGRPIVVVTMRGVRSGRLRRLPLMRIEHNGVYALVASAGGSPQNPAWYANLTAEPHAELQDGTVIHDCTAREASGLERAAWWSRAVAAFPAYAELQQKTDREMPVLLLEARSAGPSASSGDQSA